MQTLMKMFWIILLVAAAIFVWELKIPERFREPLRERMEEADTKAGEVIDEYNRKAVAERKRRKSSQDITPVRDVKPRQNKKEEVLPSEIQEEDETESMDEVMERLHKLLEQ